MTDETYPILKGGLGKWYKRIRRVPTSSRQTPYTPSIFYPHTWRSRTEVWKAESSRTNFQKPGIFRAFLKIGSKPVAIKSLKHTQVNLPLKNEAEALNRLQWVNWMPPFHIAPKLYEYLKFDQASRCWFIAFEWFEIEQSGEGLKWEKLEDILKKGPLPTGDLLELQHSLYRAIRIMHSLGVVHGDLKDEHVLVKVVDPVQDRKEYDFSQIRLIDFGLSYLHGPAEWLGASLGFCSPYFWNPANRSLDMNFSCLDWYGADALLYYALTGECFPIASPAYYELTSSREDHFQQLRTTLQNRWIYEPDTPRKVFANWLVNRLGQRDPRLTRIRDSYYRQKILSISREPAWWFVGTLFLAASLSWVLRVGEWHARFPPFEEGVAIGLTLLALAGIRLWKRKKFMILDQEAYLQEELDKPVWPWQKKRSTWFWQGLLPALVLCIFGALALPHALFPALPVCVGLFVNNRKSAFGVGLGILLGGGLAWFHLMITDMVGKSHFNPGGFGMMHFPPPFFNLPGLGIILISWMAGFGLVLLRLRWRRSSLSNQDRSSETNGGRYLHYRQERLNSWLLVISAVLLTWLLPWLLEWIMLFPMHLSPIFLMIFLMTGLLSLALVLVAAFYADWRHLA
jgi:serine/threonine protein kinase